MRIPDDVRPLSVQVLAVMCLMPGIIIVRNYYHGRLMVERRTAGMAAGSMLRVLGIYLSAQLLFSFGALNALSAAAVLIIGFVIETAVVLQVARNGSADRVNATENM
jgi:hypothetical protein